MRQVVQRFTGYLDREQSQLEIWVDTGWKPDQMVQARQRFPEQTFRVITINDEEPGVRWVH